MEDTVSIWGDPQEVQLSEKFRVLVDPGGVCHKRIIIQGIQIKNRFSYDRRSYLIIKGGVTVSYIHSLSHNNSQYRLNEDGHNKKCSSNVYIIDITWNHSFSVPISLPIH